MTDTTGSVSVLLNRGDGTFQEAVNYITEIASSSVYSSDLDGDADMDLAVTNESPDGISILFNSTDIYSGCQYIVGDANDDDVFNGMDVTYAVAYFKGGPLPPYAVNVRLETYGM